MKELGLPATAPLEGYHILYLGAQQDEAFKEEYQSIRDVNLRIMCIKLHSTLSAHLMTPIDKAAEEEERRSGAAVPGPENLKPHSPALYKFSARRWGMLPAVRQKAKQLFAKLRRHPCFPLFEDIDAMPAEELARTWADDFRIDKMLEDAALSGGRISERTAELLENHAEAASWFARDIRDFVRTAVETEAREEAKRQELAGPSSSRQSKRDVPRR